MRCAKCIHHNICYYEEEVIAPDKNNECENFEEESPHGKWIMQTKFSRRVCSKCNKAYRTSFAPANFCPNCGADMRGDTDEID